MQEVRLHGKHCSYNACRGGRMEEVERSRSQSREQRREQLPSIAVVPTLVTRVKLP